MSGSRWGNNVRVGLNCRQVFTISPWAVGSPTMFSYASNGPASHPQTDGSLDHRNKSGAAFRNPPPVSHTHWASKEWSLELRRMLSPCENEGNFLRAQTIKGIKAIIFYKKWIQNTWGTQAEEGLLFFFNSSLFYIHENEFKKKDTSGTDYQRHRKISPWVTLKYNIPPMSLYFV